MSDKSPTRGRPRAFDRTVALEAAMRVFWQKGFTATSMTDLCEAMGIASPSLYAAFGSKEQLYLEAIRHYGEQGAPLIAQALDTAPTARQGIEAYLRFSARMLSCPTNPRGCMVVLSSVASEGVSGLSEMILGERQRSPKVLADRIRRGVEAGELGPDLDAEALARFYVTIQQGMSIQARDGATAEELDAVATAAMRAWPGA